MDTIKNVLWSNDLNIDNWRDDLIDYYPDCENDEEALYSRMIDVNHSYLEDEIAQAENVFFDEGLLVIADLGLWWGRRPGYKQIGSSLADVFRDTVIDTGTFYVDENGDVRAENIHHDGTNYYLYRAWRPGLSDVQRDYFLCKIINGRASRRDINRYTVRIGDHFADLYGFKIRKAPEKRPA